MNTVVRFTVGEIAKHLHERPWRIQNVLATRPHIEPIERIGNFRIYDAAGVEAVRAELAGIDARRRVGRLREPARAEDAR